MRSVVDIEEDEPVLAYANGHYENYMSVQQCGNYTAIPKNSVGFVYSIMAYGRYENHVGDVVILRSRMRTSHLYCLQVSSNTGVACSYTRQLTAAMREVMSRAMRRVRRTRWAYERCEGCS